MGMTVELFAIPDETAMQFFGNAGVVEAWLTDNMLKESEAKLNLEKEWHAVNFLLELNGISPALMEGGREVGEGLGYGPARLRMGEDTSQFATAIAAITTDEARNHFDFALFESKGIYPNVWARRDPSDQDFVLQAFATLKKFTANAARRSDALLVALF